jgi:hypothetical protein
MTALVKVFVGFAVIAVFAFSNSCSQRTARFYYLSKQTLSPPIDVPAAILVNVQDTSLTQTFKTLKKDIETSISNDLSNNVFTEINKNNPVLKVRVNVNQMSFEQQPMWGCLWFPLLYCGVPGNKIEGKVELFLDITDIDKRFYKSYHAKQNVKKWIGYYNIPKYIPGKQLPEKFPTKTAFELAMDDIKLQITKDRAEIMQYFMNQKKTLSTSETKDSNKIAQSDVDKNIPLVNNINKKRFALIIGNQDYSNFQSGLTPVQNVPFAENDALIFKEYATKTLGVPEDNVILKLNARTVEFNRAIDDISLIIKALNGEAEILLYFAGHGLPDPQTTEPLLMPVDVSQADLNFAIQLNSLYQKLTIYPATRITVFLDACFSGGARNAGLLTARSVHIKPKLQALKGNLIVFAATRPDQQALAWQEKKHGLFTYLLLKKFQENAGELTYKELSDHLMKEVPIKSLLINHAEQNSEILISPEILDKWEKWKF